MRQLPVFRYFFERTVMPIGEKDKFTLAQQGTDATHWLIAVAWNEEKGIDGWQVVVYPLLEGLPFWHFAPYEIPSYTNMDEAVVRSKEVMALCRQDVFVCNRATGNPSDQAM